MTHTSIVSTEQEILSKVKEDFERNGYRVVLSPRSDDLPDFLRNFQPDAIAQRNDENVVIEVTAKRSKPGMHRLGSLAEALEAHPNWRLEVVIGTSARGDEVRRTFPSLNEIRSGLRSARQVYANEERRAALLLLWSVLESATHIRLQKLDVRRREYRDPSALIKDLVSYGFVDQRDYPRLLELASLRNAVAHGFITTPIDTDSFEFLYGVAEGLVSRRDRIEDEQAESQ